MEPSSDLLEAMEKGIPATVLKGFNRFPGVSMRLEPISEGGTALFLSNVETGQNAKNH
jgi:hypothetical protein